MPAVITAAVFPGGTEKKEIPRDMNMADESYKERLREVFADHPAGSSFENFYQAQILWDETMAHSAAELADHLHDVAFPEPRRPRRAFGRQFFDKLAVGVLAQVLKRRRFFATREILFKVTL